MKILHVNTHMNTGGIGQYIATLTKALKDRGLECVVASSGGDLEPELRKNGIAHRHLNIRTKFEFGPKVLRAAFAVGRIIKDEKIDLVHAHSRVSQAVSFFAARMTKAPYISTCHGYFKTRLSRRLFDTWGKRVVAISGAVKTHLERDFGVGAARIELIYSGIDAARFSADYAPERIAKAKISLGLREGPVIGTMGRLSPVKGQRFLIEAMKYIISKKNNAQCLIIGSGAEEKALRDEAIALGVEKSVNFIKPDYDDIPLYLSCMDIFALPSVQEGLGLALLEAMAAAKPCIGSDIGGISDIMEDGINALLIPVGNPRAIGEAALRLLADKVLSREIGLAGRETVRKRFSLGSMADKMIELYEGVINEE